MNRKQMLERYKGGGEACKKAWWQAFGMTKDQAPRWLYRYWRETLWPDIVKEKLLKWEERKRQKNRQRKR